MAMGMNAKLNQTKGYQLQFQSEIEHKFKKKILIFFHLLI